MVVCVSYLGYIVYFPSRSSRGFRITTESMPYYDDDDYILGRIYRKIIISRGVLVKAYAIVIIIAVCKLSDLCYVLRSCSFRLC